MRKSKQINKAKSKIKSIWGGAKGKKNNKVINRALKRKPLKKGFFG